MALVEQRLGEVITDLATSNHDDVHAQDSLATRWRNGSPAPTT
jgi:hypothetical protein